MEIATQEGTGKPFALYGEGDVLVMKLPPVVGLSIYTCLFNGMDIIGNYRIRRIVLDYSSAEQLPDSGIVGLRKLGERVRADRIQLLILHPSIEIGRTLAQLLPQAQWINGR